MWTNTILVNEITPGKYTFYCEVLHGEKGHGFVTSEIDDNGDTSLLHETLKAFCRYFIKRLNDKKIKIGKTKSITKYKVNGEKRSIKEITIVSKTKYISDDLKNKFPRKIDWLTSWKVRGHWRKVDTIGKDRLGEYKVKGYTWVKDCIKGIYFLNHRLCI